MAQPRRHTKEMEIIRSTVFATEISQWVSKTLILKESPPPKGYDKSKNQLIGKTYKIDRSKSSTPNANGDFVPLNKYRDSYPLFKLEKPTLPQTSEKTRRILTDIYIVLDANEEFLGIPPKSISGWVKQDKLNAFDMAIQKAEFFQKMNITKSVGDEHVVDLRVGIDGIHVVSFDENKARDAIGAYQFALADRVLAEEDMKNEIKALHRNAKTKGNMDVYVRRLRDAIKLWQKKDEEREERLKQALNLFKPKERVKLKKDWKKKDEEDAAAKGQETLDYILADILKDVAVDSPDDLSSILELLPDGDAADFMTKLDTVRAEKTEEARGGNVPTSPTKQNSHVNADVAKPKAGKMNIDEWKAKSKLSQVEAVKPKPIGEKAEQGEKRPHNLDDELSGSDEAQHANKSRKRQ